MRRRWVLMGLCLLGVACREPAPREDGPAWLAELQAQIVAEPLGNPPEALFRYRYRGQVVYYRPPRCCDVFGELYDRNGQLLCHPDGGFAGRGDGGCDDFAEARSDCALIWQDPRGKGTARSCPQATSEVAPEY